MQKIFDDDGRYGLVANKLETKFEEMFIPIFKRLKAKGEHGEAIHSNDIELLLLHAVSMAAMLTR